MARVLRLLPVLALVLPLLLVSAPVAVAANPPPVMYYYVTLPEDDALQMMDVIDAPNTQDPASPLRSITSVSIDQPGTLVYWDQWEPDSGTTPAYDTDIANPTNLYSASNPNGTQIWGNGEADDGCPPFVNGTALTCTDANDGPFNTGDVLVTDNLVDVEGTFDAYSRDPTKVFFDGRDKVGASQFVVMTRAMWPDATPPGSLMAGAVEVLETTRWGTAYVAPTGENDCTDTSPSDYFPTNSNCPFEDTRWFIMAGPGGATIDVDANGDGDLGDANDLNDSVLAEGGKLVVDGIEFGATLTVVAGGPVQVNHNAGDLDSTWEMRWAALVPRENWTDEYYTPVGTAGKSERGSTQAGCTEVWVYNPGTSGITVNVTTGGATTPLSVPAGNNARTANILYNNGARLQSTGGGPFLPVSVSDCTKDTSTSYPSEIYDWGTPLIPVDQLSDQLLVPWAPGCTTTSGANECVDDPGDLTPNNPYYYSRAVVWVTPLNDTTLYVDLDGSGITCPGGAGAEVARTATALSSYRFHDDSDGPNNVLDMFWAQAYSNSDGNVDWAGDWTESGDTGGATGGDILVTGGELNFNNGVTSGDYAQRSIGDLSAANTSAVLSFYIPREDVGNTLNDRIRVRVSPDGSTWRNVVTFDNGTTPQVYRYVLQPSDLGTNTTIRFEMVDGLESGENWYFDAIDVHWRVGTRTGDYDMTAAQIRTCDGTILVGAYGENPALSLVNDGEALDLGTWIAPFRPPLVQTGTIGNYVWLDEDGDGDQDAGEVGIPNVLVTVTKGAESYSTYTDANGGYLFTGLGPGNWTVTVTPPAGLNATYDEDNGTPNDSIPGSPNNQTVVNLQAGEEHLTADFGYNWSTTAETGDPDSPPSAGATGAIGDRVWIDTDGQGDQDPEEIGLAGVEVQLWYDSNSDGTIDAQYGSSVTTDANGNYIFDNLPAGIYEVRIPNPPGGYTQTGDPDQFGVACTACDDQTTTPIVLGPGDVFVNADFGYEPTSADDYGSIGDTVWLDANRNGSQDGLGAAEEPGIPGVTVALIKDLDGDGFWDEGEPIIATDITDENGQYLFTGLPVANGLGTDDYLVWVNDTDHVLGELTPTYDFDDAAPATGYRTGLGISAASDLTSGGYDNRDFGYAPPGHDSGEGIIGDTIFLDRDADGSPDDGEGMEGVVVQLLGTDGRLLAETVTDENGNYTFGGLAAGTYTVRVDTSTLPGSGLTNTVDPDGGTANESSVTIGSGGINLDQDFGYRDTTGNAISGTLWEDTDADGTLEGGETTRFGAVTVNLYEDSNGNGVLDGSDALVGTTVTDSSGNYYFGCNDVECTTRSLPEGTYFVDVTDSANLLNGYWKSNGTNAGSDNNSQVDPYKVTVGGGEHNTTGDFGYYVEPGAVGNLVWSDVSNLGFFDSATESGIPNVEVTLTIVYPNSSGTVVLKTTTDANGYYSFGNLLLDEDYNGDYTGSETGEPTYTITVAAPSGSTSTYDSSPDALGVGNGTDDNADNDAGELVFPFQGGTDDTNDFGYNFPTSVILSTFEAVWQDAAVLVTWETGSELEVMGFNLHRAESAGGPKAQLNAETIDAQMSGEPVGAVYKYPDSTVVAGGTYHYWLELVTTGGTTMEGPITPTVPVVYTDQIYLPLVTGE